MHIFAEAFPERFFQMGMAEQLFFGAAAGMAETGLVPFASTYSVFAARRAYDFICLDIAEPGPERQHRRGATGPDHRVRPVASGHRGRRDLPRHTRTHDRRPVRLDRPRAGGAAVGGLRRPDLSASPARSGADCARRVRLHLRARQGQAAARRGRCRLRVERPDDDAGPAGRRRARRAQDRRRRRPHPDTETVRRGYRLADMDSDRLA